MSEISFDFSGKVVLITGSSGGIGAIAAIGFAQTGAQVVVTGICAEKVAEISQKCDEVSPLKLKALQIVADLSREEECRRLVQTTVQLFGKINILVTNADVLWRHTINDSKYIEKYKHIMETNLDSVVYLVHFCAKYLSKTKGNVVINSAVEGIVESSCRTIQCISNNALDVFNRYMAVELAPRRIRINAINPGAIKNNSYLYSCMSKHDYDSLFNTYPFIRDHGKSPRQVRNIANAILYLASDHADCVTGLNYVDDCFCCKCFSIEIRAFYSLSKDKFR